MKKFTHQRIKALNYDGEYSIIKIHFKTLFAVGKEFE